MGMACGNAFYIELHHFEGDSPPSPDNASNNKGLNSFFFKLLVHFKDNSQIFRDPVQH